MFSAERKLKFQLVFSSLVVLSALLVTWLIMGESAPFHNYFIWHVDLPKYLGDDNSDPLHCQRNNQW